MSRGRKLETPVWLWARIVLERTAEKVAAEMQQTPSLALPAGCREAEAEAEAAAKTAETAAMRRQLDRTD